MSKEFIEAEKKRLDEFIAHQALLHEQNKQRAPEHADNAVVLADFAIQTFKDHVYQIAALDAAADAHV